MANLSNINNKFLVTTGGNVLIGQTSAVGSSILQVTGASTFTGNILMGNTVTNPASGFADQTGIGLKYSTTVPTIEVSSDSSAMQLGRSSTGGEGQILGLRKAGTIIHNFDTNNVSIGTNATFAGTITSGALTVGTSGTSRFTDTNAFPLQLNRGLAVDVVGTAGTIFGLGAYSTGTTYIDAVRIVGVLDANGTDGDMLLQVLNSGTHTTALTLNNDTNATFAGTVTAYQYYKSSTAYNVIGTGSSGEVILRPTAWNLSTAQSSFSTTLATIGTDTTIAGTLAAGATTLTSTNPSILVLNPTASNYGGITFKYGGVTKGTSIYNSGSMVYGGEVGTFTRLQSGGQYCFHADATNQNVHIGGTTDTTYKLQVTGTTYTSGNATFAGDITLTPGNSNKIILTPDVNSHYITGNGYWVDVVGNAAEVFRVFGGVGGTSEYMRVAGNGDKTFISSYSGGTFPLRVGHGTYASFTPTFVINDSGNVGIGVTGPTYPLQVAKNTTNNLTHKIGNDSHSEYGVSGLQDHTVTLECPSYYNSKVIITASQTNGGTTNNIYLEGIWQNNYTSHIFTILHNIGSLSGSTLTTTVSAGPTSTSGRLVVFLDYGNGSFANMVVRVCNYYGAHTGVIT
jgi:hypothetical protein